MDNNLSNGGRLQLELLVVGQLVSLEDMPAAHPLAMATQSSFETVYDKQAAVTVNVQFCAL